VRENPVRFNLLADYTKLADVLARIEEYEITLTERRLSREEFIPGVEGQIV
jgi:hypothetical protein